MNRLPTWTLVALAIAAVLSCVVLVQRFRVESSNRAVGIALEYSVVAEIAAASGLTVPEALEQLKASGLTGVTISELTIDELVRRGDLNLWELRDEYRVGSGPGLIGYARQAREALVERYPHFNGRNVDPAVQLATPVGFDEVQAETVRSAGLDCIARIRSLSGLDSGQIEARFARAAELGCTFYLPEGDGVLGQAGAIEVSIQAMKRHGLIYLTPEFTRIVGDGSVKLRAPENTVRLHSIQQAEVDRMQSWEISERFVRAFRERNIRYMLLRLPTVTEKAPIDSAKSLISSIWGGVDRYGGGVKTPRPFEGSRPAEALTYGIVLFTACWIFGLASTTIRSSMIRAGAMLAIFMLAVLCLSEAGRQYLALVAAICAPIIATVAALQGSRTVYQRYLVAVAVCLGGALVVPGLLAGDQYMIQAAAFKGVKAAHLLPVVAVGALVVSWHFDFRQIARSPVLWGTAIASLLGLFAIMFMLARTGNESPAAVPGFELRLRALLDDWLYVRPRSKELFAFPALFVGFALFNRASDLRATAALVKGVAAAAITFGVVGLASLVNTLAHLHTPLTVSFYRIAAGVLIGGLIGLVIWPFVRRVFLNGEGADNG